MFKISNIKSLTDELRCTQCGKLLSVFPVYYCSAIGNVCGRCTATLDWMIANGTLERAVAYEAVAKYLIFPCSNKDSGCTAKLKWNQVDEHEKSCTVRDFLCPFDKNAGCENGCVWKGNIKELIDHLKVAHPTNVISSQTNLLMNVQKDNLQIFYTCVAEQTFIVLTKYAKDTHKMYCVVMCTSTNMEPENQYFRFQLEIGSHDNYFLILRKNITEQFVNTTEILNNYDKMIAVDVTSVKAMLDNSTPDGYFFYKVNIIKKGKNEVAAISKQLNPSEPPSTKTLDSAMNPPHPPEVKNENQPLKNTLQPMKNPQQTKNPPPTQKSSQSAKKPASSGNATITKPPLKRLSEMDKQLLEELECPVCSNHMIPPIYICPTGHSICNECKFKVQQCPSCRTVIMATRNYTLEKLTTKVPYPCKYVELGCLEILDSTNILVHQQNCIYASNKCPLKMLIACTAKNDLVNIVGHIREAHHDYIVEVNQEYARNLKAKITSSYYAAIHENEIFIVCCKHSATNGPVKFNVMHVGMKPNRPKYRFELQFLDQTNTGMKLIINQLCQPLTPNPSTALKKCLALPLDMLEPFISIKEASTLFFKFFIQRM